MKIHLFAIVTLAFIAASTVTFAQGGPAPGGMHYNPGTEATVKGRVEEVQQYQGRHNWTGIHLMLKTESETLEVHVGPSWYLDQQPFSFAKGDSLEIVGSKGTIGGKPALLAREISKEGKTLVLRNAQGIPQCSGRQRSN